MRRGRHWLALAALPALAGCVHNPSTSPAMAMWQMDCGRFDIKNFEGHALYPMPVSCYLIRDGDDYVLFDAGLGTRLIGKPDVQETQTVSLDRSLADQFAAIGVDPAKVSTLIVSHFHGDHHGQADLFPNARRLIGAGDAAALRGESDQGKLGPWLKGERTVEEVGADRDLTGDGRLKVLFTPGHTPGHLSMLVKLRGASFILTGDLVHSRRQLDALEPSRNHVDKVRGKAEIERMVALAKSEGATIVVGHDRDDVARFPQFPDAAE